MNAINPIAPLSPQAFAAFASLSMADVLRLVEDAYGAPPPPVSDPGPAPDTTELPDNVVPVVFGDRPACTEIPSQAPEATVEPAPEPETPVIESTAREIAVTDVRTPEIAAAESKLVAAVAAALEPDTPEIENEGGDSAEDEAEASVYLPDGKTRNAMVDRKAFSHALASVARVIERRNTIEVLSHACIKSDATGHGLIVEGTDLDMTVRVAIPAIADPDFSAVLNAERMATLVKKALGDSIYIAVTDLDTPEAELLLGGSSKVKLQGRRATDFPDPLPDTYPLAFDMKAAELRDLLGDVAFSISTEETRHYLNGVYMHAVDTPSGKRLCAVATDGHRLARRVCSVDLDGRDMPGAILPRKAVDVLLKLLPKPRKMRKGEADTHPDVVKVELSGVRFRFTFGDTTVTTKLIDGTFPDYTRVIPRGNDKSLCIDSRVLADTVDRMSTISSERGRAVRLAMTENLATFTVANPDAGTISESVPVRYTADPMDIGFNSRYLVDICRMFDGQMEIMLADLGSPSLIRAPGAGENADRLFVLMPMRV